MNDAIASPSAFSTRTVDRAVASRPCAPPSLPSVREWISWLHLHGFGGLELGLLVVVQLGAIGLVIAAFIFTRQQDTELFDWGRHLLNLERAALMTALLPIGAVGLAIALLSACRGFARAQFSGLVIATFCGAAFLVLLGIDYEGKAYRRLLPGASFRPNPRYVAARFGVRLPRDWNARPAAAIAAHPPTALAASQPREVSAANGRDLFLRVCASCHGARGEGLPGSGRDLRTSTFVAGLDDAKLVEFLQVGRPPWDKDNITGVQMPARGGDPRVTFEDLRDVTAYLREMQARTKPAAAAATGSAPTPSINDGAQDGTASLASPPPLDEEPPVFIVERSYLPPAAEGPSGLSKAYRNSFTRPRWAIPDTARNFFGAYFALTAVGATQVLIALAALIGALIAVWRHGNAGVSRPGLTLLTAGWCWATTCWTIVFALIYCWR